MCYVLCVCFIKKKYFYFEAFPKGTLSDYWRSVIEFPLSDCFTLIELRVRRSLKISGFVFYIFTLSIKNFYLRESIKSTSINTFYHTVHKYVRILINVKQKKNLSAADPEAYFLFVIWMHIIAPAHLLNKRFIKTSQLFTTDGGEK